MTTSSTHDQHVPLTATAACQACDIAPTACSDLVEHEDGLPAPALTSSYPPQVPAFGAAGGSQNEAILIPTDSESESMSESDGETDEDVPSLKKINERINEETTTPPISTSPASTMTTVLNTPQALPLGAEVDDHLSAPVQRSPSPTFVTTSVPPGQGPGDGLDPSRRSPGSSTEIAEQDHGQTEDASEPLSSQGDSREPGGTAELPRRTRPHGSASQNASTSTIDGDGKTAEDGDWDSSSDDSDVGNDGDDDDYNDDGSCSDTDGEDCSRSKKRGPDRSSSATRSDSGHADDSSNDYTAKSSPRLHKRLKVAHDREDRTPVRRQNSMPRSGGRMSRSPRHRQTASMLSPPASTSLSDSESSRGSDHSKASAASFGEWQLQNAALKCVTIDGFTTYQLEFQRAQAHSCGGRRETRPQKPVKSKNRGRKQRDETKGRRCGLCSQPGHNARTCQNIMGTADEEVNS